MKEITIYQTKDGCRFDKKEEAANYETLCNKCNKIDSMLTNIGRGLEYNEYIQQKTRVVKQAFSDFLDIVAEAIPEYAIWSEQTKNGERHISHIGRVISNYNIRCLEKLYFRFSCISFDNGREFQQPYFVTHQNEATKEVFKTQKTE